MASTYRSRLSSKGQLVIPAELRKRLRLRPGTEVMISEDQGRLVIEDRKQTFEKILELYGVLRGKDKELQKIIEEDKKREQEREREDLERLARLK